MINRQDILQPRASAPPSFRGGSVGLRSPIRKAGLIASFFVDIGVET